MHRRRRSRAEFGLVLSCNHKNTRDTVVSLTTKKSAAVVVGTFSSDLTLSAYVSDRTADIHHLNFSYNFLPSALVLLSIFDLLYAPCCKIIEC